MSQTEKNLRDIGWDADEARRRARIIDSADANAKSQGVGLPTGSYVAVSWYSCPGEPREGRVDAEGRLTVGGCVPSAGMVVGLLSKPYRFCPLFVANVGDVVGILADGTEVTVAVEHCGVREVEAQGKRYPHVLAAAVALTPAE